jgi:hypothetical protein
VGDGGSSLGLTLRTLRIDMNPLPVVRALGERIDTWLTHVDPAGGAKRLADKGLEVVEGVGEFAHGEAIGVAIESILGGAGAGGPVSAQACSSEWNS